MIVISPDGRTPLEDSRLVPIVWKHLARQADRIGRDWAQPAAGQWRLDAMSPEAPGQYRMLAELLGYLEREDVDVSVPGPFTDADVDVVPRVRAVIDRWDSLFELVVQELKKVGLEKDKDPERWQSEPKGSIKRGRLTGWSLRFAGDIDWPALDRLNLDWWLAELLLAPEDTWRPSRDPVPAFGVGVTVPTDAGWPSGLEEGDPLRAAIKATSTVTVGTTWRGRRGRLFATLPVREIASDSATLDSQAELVAGWARRELDSITRIDVDR